MIKEWYTARELADLSLDGLPKSESGIIRKIKKENWSSRDRIGRGGGFEYHVNNLPDAVKIQIVERLVGEQDDALQAPICEDGADAVNNAEKRFNSKVIILKVLDLFIKQSGLGKTQATKAFVRLYEHRRVEGIPDWVYDFYNSISEGSIYRWKSSRKNKEFKALKGAFGNRKGSGVLETAENGAVHDFIVGLMLEQHHLKGGHIRDLTRSKFGNELTVYKGIEAKSYPLPNIRTFERFILKWKKDNEALYLKITNPDASKSKHSIALGHADADVERLNQVWEIDASPVDVLLKDGRYNLYAIIDVWSRRMKVHISKTATTEASLQLVRKAILDWGVPEQIKTDNGADFVSQRFVNALISLEIDQHLCPPFSPEKKPYVERAIGTLQRDLMPLLPGFIGHNVKDRTAIESRKAFAQRLGVDDAKSFAVSLDQDELQKIVDEWCEHKYERRRHDGIKQSPFDKAASWNKPIQRIENERAIDILLAPLPSGSSTRRITKKGLRIDNYEYVASEIGIYIGQTVSVRCDPEDMGTVHCFHIETNEFLFTAICPALTGADRKQASLEAKRVQAQFLKEETAAVRRNMKQIKPEVMARMVLDQAKEDNQAVTAFPKQSEIYETDGLKQAARVDHKEDVHKPIEEDAITKHQRLISQELVDNLGASQNRTDHDIWWDQAQAMILKKNNGIPLTDSDEKRLAYWETQPWYIAKKELMQAKMGQTPL